MYQDFQNHKKSDSIKWIAVCVAIVLLAVMVTAAMTQGFTNGNPYGWVDETKTEAPVEKTQVPLSDDAPLIITTDATEVHATTAEPRLLLSAGPAMASAAADGSPTVSKTITATVMPVDAPDKAVDWSISWCTPLNDTAVVTDYLTVTPDSDGSLTATITAYQGFEGGSAYVTATTRIGGFTATCLVTYQGAPETFGFIYNGTSYNTTGGINLTAGTTNAITLDLRNTLGAVGSNYGNFEIKRIHGSGKFYLQKDKVVNGTSQTSEDIVFDLESNSYSFTDDILGDQYTLTIPMETFLTASISDNILTINAIKSEASFATQRPRTGYHFKYKGPYRDPRSPYDSNVIWDIVVRDTVSGQETLIYVDITSTVTSVALSESYLSF